jgi:hypothetical protein
MVGMPPTPPLMSAERRESFRNHFQPEMAQRNSCRLQLALSRLRRFVIERLPLFFRNAFTISVLRTILSEPSRASRDFNTHRGTPMPLQTSTDRPSWRTLLNGAARPIWYESG